MGLPVCTHQDDYGLTTNAAPVAMVKTMHNSKVASNFHMKRCELRRTLNHLLSEIGKVPLEDTP